MMTATATKDPTSTAPRRRLPPRAVQILLVLTLAVATLHLLVATPHFVVRLLRGSPVESFPGIENFALVSDTLWRGAAPSSEGYEALAAAGVGTVIDLRAEVNPAIAAAPATGLGLDWIHVPVRDGQTPTAAQVAAIAEAIATADDPVFVHCQAGVGRTGTVVAALHVAQGASPASELLEALRIGPLSLEQQMFVLRSGTATPAVVAAITAASRVIDSPRRMWSRLTG